MKQTIIDKYQLEHLVDIGVLYKTRDNTYHNLIDHKVWGYVCMPPSMVEDVAGKTVDVKVDKDDGEAERWVTDDGQAWYIQPWMLVDYYDRIKQWGKYRPVSWGKSDDSDLDIYNLQIMSQAHLDELVKQGVVKKETLGDGYVYRPVITDMNVYTMPDTMAEQMCGKIFVCHGTGTTWVEDETEHKWSIAQWMLDRNYGYLLSRSRGQLDPEELEDEEEPEDDEKEEEYAAPRNFVNIIGEITEKSEAILTLSVPEVCVLVHITDCDYGVGQRVSVEGYLVRTSNMMGYPEIKCTYIQEV